MNLVQYLPLTSENFSCMESLCNWFDHGEEMFTWHWRSVTLIVGIAAGCLSSLIALVQGAQTIALLTLIATAILVLMLFFIHQYEQAAHMDSLLKNFNEQNEELNTQNNYLRSSVELLNETKTFLTQQLQQLQGNNDSLKKTLQQHQEQLTQQYTVNETLQKEQQQHLKACKLTNEQLQMNLTSLQYCQEQTQQEQLKLAGITEKLESCQREFSRLSGEINNLRDVKIAFEGEVYLLSNQISRLQGLLNHLESCK